MSFRYLHMALRSDKGDYRMANEDAGCSAPGVGFCALADGVGGAEAGDFASSRVIAELMTSTISWNEHTTLSMRLELLRKALQVASDDIAALVKERQLNGCGTTVVLMVFDPQCPEKATIMHVGDSRAYRLRGESLQQMTGDHTVATELAQTGQTLPKYLCDMLTRAIGMTGAEEVEVTNVDVQKNDTFLLCTDGLYNALPTELIRRALRSHQTRSLDSTADRLMRQALIAKAKDNVTFSIVKVRDWDK